MLDSPRRSRAARGPPYLMLLIAPGLLAHAAACSAHGAFARLAYYAPQPTREIEGIAHLACAALGVANAPIAALTASGAGVEAGDAYWLLAEPVTLVASRSNVAIAGRAQSLTPEEAQELLTALNAHFHGDGMDFVAPRPGLWLARLASAPSLVTTSVDRASSGPL